jgi:alpha-aminoadipate carrier protein LysW
MYSHERVLYTVKSKENELMKTAKCPFCKEKINLEGCEEFEVIECPECGTDLEIVSLTPPLLEEVPDDDDDWDDDGDDDWDGDDD